MAKVTGGLLSLKATGQIGKSIVFGSWKGVPYARQHVVPANPKSTNQTTTRDTFAALNYMYNQMGVLSRAPWQAFVKGKPLTDRNKHMRDNMIRVRGQANMQNYVGSPSANGGEAATAISAAAGGTSGDINVTLTAPPTPTGWTLVSAVARAFADGDPTADVVPPLAEADNTTPTAGGDTVVALTGLAGTTLCVVSGWLTWTKPDGTTAYGISLQTTVTTT